VLVDQAPIGRTPRSNPVTYLKAFDPIRELFSLTKDARARGLTASHFSFNVPGGRCEACQGEGEVRGGDAVPRRRLRALRAVRRHALQAAGARGAVQGQNVHQVLDMTVREALTFFSGSPKVLRRLHVLDEIGLGYLRLGQPATTLSGGEAQRIKIAAHLASMSGERVLYILDEPTTGLHFDDIAKLLAAFSQAGRSRAHAARHRTQPRRDQDRRPHHRSGADGGDAGGEVVTTGTPEQVARVEESYTGQALRPVLAASRVNGAE
jgi:excinuclease ABC subunit A